MIMDKTVYILGAGFSSPAGGPAQDAILGEILNLADSPEITPHKDRLKSFLQDVLNVDATKVSLEDIYTPVDRCLVDGIALRGMGEEKLQELRDSLGYLIAQAIKARFGRFPITANKYAQDFAKHLVALAAIRAEKARGATDASEAKKYDPFSVISPQLGYSPRQRSQHRPKGKRFAARWVIDDGRLRTVWRCRLLLLYQLTERT